MMAVQKDTLMRRCVVMGNVVCCRATKRMCRIWCRLASRADTNEVPKNKVSVLQNDERQYLFIRRHFLIVVRCRRRVGIWYEKLVAWWRWIDRRCRYQRRVSTFFSKPRNAASVLLLLVRTHAVLEPTVQYSREHVLSEWIIDSKSNFSNSILTCHFRFSKNGLPIVRLVLLWTPVVPYRPQTQSPFLSETRSWSRLKSIHYQTTPVFF